MTDTFSPPKAGTKEAKLVSRLSRSEVTLAQLAGLLAWQPHTVRAAMTRLRKRGYIIDRIAKTERSAAKFKIRRTG